MNEPATEPQPTKLEAAAAAIKTFEATLATINAMIDTAAFNGGPDGFFTAEGLMLAVLGLESLPGPIDVTDRLASRKNGLRSACEALAERLKTLDKVLYVARRNGIRQGHRDPAFPCAARTEFADVIRYAPGPTDDAVECVAFDQIPEGHPIREHFKPDDYADPPSPPFVGGKAIVLPKYSGQGQAVFELHEVLTFTRANRDRWNHEAAEAKRQAEHKRRQEQIRIDSDPLERIRRLDTSLPNVDG